MATVHVTIRNWDKFNPKRDQNSYTWLRLSNDILTDPDLFGLTAAQKFAWVGILCLASKKNTATVELDTEWLAATTQIKPEQVDTLLFFLEKKRIVSVDEVPATIGGRALSRTSTSTTPTNETYERDERDERDVRTNERDVTLSNSASESDPRDAKVPLEKIWNENCGTLATVRTLSSSRKRHATARWRENPDEAYWIAVVQRIAASKFCRGEGTTGWRATFDWLLKPDTHARVLEGKYDDREKPANDDWAKHLIETHGKAS